MILISSITLSLATGCTTNMGRKETAGTLIGGAAGALIGSEFGGGTGRLIGTGIGAVAGALAGENIGKSLDEKDKDRNKTRR